MRRQACPPEHRRGSGLPQTLHRQSRVRKRTSNCHTSREMTKSKYTSNAREGEKGRRGENRTTKTPNHTEGEPTYVGPTVKVSERLSGQRPNWGLGDNRLAAVSP